MPSVSREEDISDAMHARALVRPPHALEAPQPHPERWRDGELGVSVQIEVQRLSV